jgi:hypothetical protein
MVKNKTNSIWCRPSIRVEDNLSQLQVNFKFKVQYNHMIFRKIPESCDPENLVLNWIVQQYHDHQEFGGAKVEQFNDAGSYLA